MFEVMFSFRDPFRGGNNIIVMCETYGPDGEPHPTNSRHECAENMEKAAEHEPWFGIEQVRLSKRAEII